MRLQFVELPRLIYLRCSHDNDTGEEYAFPLRSRVRQRFLIIDVTAFVNQPGERSETDN